MRVKCQKYSKLDIGGLVSLSSSSGPGPRSGPRVGPRSGSGQVQDKTQRSGPGLYIKFGMVPTNHLIIFPREVWWVVSGGWRQTKFSVSPGPGLSPGTLDLLDLSLDLTWDPYLDLSLTKPLQ